ncbi:MAG: S8 family serine peptidase [Bacteroidota bacterium]|jgi:subtilisin family serine protease|nr:S8 family serine peptidase [Bacteroidota bacterium]
MKRFPLLPVLALLLFAACSEQPSGPAPEQTGRLDKVVSVDPSGSDVDLKDRYIVVFKESVGNVDQLVDEMTRGNGSTVHYRYRHTIKGFAATLPPQALEGLRRNPNIASITPDAMMYAVGTQSPVPSWGLDRIDQTTPSLNNSFTYPNDGSGVTVYIIDTGILYGHQEFGGRASFGFDAFGGNGSDLNGHGTHVAGTVGGTTVGVAKNVNLISVRVLDRRGSGSTAGVIAGVDWVAGHNSGTAVANMSLGGGFYQPLNDAVADAVLDGVTFCVAAGNESTLASTKSPASELSAITVGATASGDIWASYSNYGSVVDILAPGTGIYSAWKSSTTSYNTISGTSMASPHVAGVAALYLAANPGSAPATVRNALVNNAPAVSVVRLPSNTTNKIVYTGFIGGGTPPTPPADPTNLAAAAVAYNQINLSWNDNATNETNYYIEQSPDGTSSWQQIASLGADVESYSVTGLSANTTYYFRVRAGNGGGYSGYSNTANAQTLSQPSQTEVWISNVSTSSAWSNSVIWNATLAVTVTAAANAPVPNATVFFTWNGGSGSAITDMNGVATITTGGLNSKKVASIQMDVSTVSGSNLSYQGDNGLLPVTVNKPN